MKSSEPTEFEFERVNRLDPMPVPRENFGRSAWAGNSYHDVQMGQEYS
jgi:hypothetical protein